mmetsp:Transcript_13763/g.31468  ORF Transcript_13763/g.31468 Transcript_13763/m.31468 type:complete len:141 (-) Transcript_13763:131-553(-)
MMRSEKTPPSHGVSSGPKTVAFHTKRLSSETGLALQPSGGSCLIDLRSDRSRSVAAEDMAGASNTHEKKKTNSPRNARKEDKRVFLPPLFVCVPPFPLAQRQARPALKQEVISSLFEGEGQKNRKERNPVLGWNPGLSKQ